MNDYLRTLNPPADVVNAGFMLKHDSQINMAKPTILLVDDERQFRESLSAALHDEFHVLTASNGTEGLALANKYHFSLILLDLQMPGLAGVDMLEVLRNRKNMTPVFILTGNSNHEWAMKCADFNVQGYIVKPVDAEELIERIKKLLRLEDYEVLRELWGEEYEAKMTEVTHPIRKALHYINQNYQSELTRKMISASLSISPDYLSRRFHKECGLHLKEYVNRARIHKSKEHLLNMDRQISDISSSVGFLNQNYFCKLFKEHTGVTPQEYRKNSSI